MILLENSASIASLADAKRSKLLNMKDQLDILIRKKLRLEFEIKNLKKSLRDQTHSSEKTLRLKASLEDSFEPISPEQALFLERNYPELDHSLRLFDQASKEILAYLEEISEENS